MSIKDVDITITRESFPVTQAGFGLPLIVGTSGAQNYTECYDLSDVENAGHGDTTEVYKMASAVFDQNPRPEKVAVVGFADNMTLESDLNDLIKDENDWYFLLCEEQGEAEVKELASWANTNDKLYFVAPDVADVAAMVTLAGETEVDNERTVLIYHDIPGSYPDAAWVGRCTPEDPGTITWKFKTLTGIDKVELSSSDINDLHDANVNTYIRKLGVNSTSEGKTVDGEYIDVIRGQDWVEARLSQRIHNLLFTTPKVPYDNRGIAMVLSEVQAVMQQATDREIIARDNDGNGMWSVDAPDREDIDTQKIADRILPDVEFVFTLAGAIHKVEVEGTILL